ncbi:hypothetical protein GCM10017673_49690 [Streptosporangium violaceochromogenes]|nr:hypothetical protein GCM10017673_49690 [Streptosporangium violaceochromogenes]
MNASGPPVRPSVARPTGRTGAPAPAPWNHRRFPGLQGGGVPTPVRALDGTGVIWTALPSPGKPVARARRSAPRG